MRNMKAPVSFTVDGQAYDVAPFMTSFGMQLQQELMTSFLGPLLGLALSAKGSVTELDIKADDATKLMMSLTNGLKPGQIDEMFKKILSGTIIANTSNCVGDNPHYDEHFQRRYLHLYKVVWKSLEAQFGDFFAGIGGFQKLADKAKKLAAK